MIYLNIGRRQLGKTTLAVSMAQRSPFRIIIDPRKQIGVNSHRVGSRFAFAQVFEQLREGTLHEIVVTPDDDLMPMFSACSLAVRQWATDYEGHSPSSRSLVLLVDEAALFDLQSSSAFRYLLRASDPGLIHVCLTAHRPKDIPTDIRAIADHWLIFRTTQEHDLAVIEQRTSSSVRLAVSMLRPHQFVHWNDATATMTRHLNPSTWYVPLGRSAVKAESGLSLPDPTDTEVLENRGKSGLLDDP